MISAANLKSIAKRFRVAFGHLEAWILILLGTTMFTLRTPMPDWHFMNLAHAATVIQTMGLMFAIVGFQIMVSIFVWPAVNFTEACERACKDHNVGAGLIAFGLLVFNGLSMLSFTLWLNGALGGQALGGA